MEQLFQKANRNRKSHAPALAALFDQQDSNDEIDSSKRDLMQALLIELVANYIIR